MPVGNLRAAAEALVKTAKSKAPKGVAPVDFREPTEEERAQKGGSWNLSPGNASPCFPRAEQDHRGFPEFEFGHLGSSSRTEPNSTGGSRELRKSRPWRTPFLRLPVASMARRNLPQSGIAKSAKKPPI